MLNTEKYHEKFIKMVKEKYHVVGFLNFEFKLTFCYNDDVGK